MADIDLGASPVTPVNNGEADDSFVVVKEGAPRLMKRRKRLLGLPLIYEASPSVPAAGGVKLFASKLAGMLVLAMIGPVGRALLLQMFLGFGQLRLWEPLGNSTTVQTIGANIATAGTATAANIASGSRRGRLRRIEYLVTVAAVNAVASWRDNLNQLSVGGVNDWEGGFWLTQHWGPATGMSNANRRGFCGIWAGAAPTDVDPSAQVNIVGMGYAAADTNMQMMHNDGAGVCTKIDLGANFPKPSVDRANTYRLEMSSPAGPTQSVDYVVTNLETGAVASGTITTNLPATTMIDLKPVIWTSVGGISAVTGFAVGKMMLQTEY